MFYFYLLLLLLFLGFIGKYLWQFFCNRLEMEQERRILIVAVLMAILASIGFYWVLTISAPEEPPVIPPVAESHPIVGQIAAPATPIAADADSTNNNNNLAAAPLTSPEARSSTNPDQPTAPLTQPQAAQHSQSNDAPPAVIREKTDRELLQDFEKQHFPNLYTQRVSLYQTLRAVQENTNATVKAVVVAPKQRELLRQVYLLRKQHYEMLEQHYHSVNKHLLEFWAHYRTGDSNYTTTVFEPVAARLQRDIKTILAERRSFNQRERKIVDVYLTANERFLRQAQPLVLSRQAAAARHYDKQNRATLLNWINSSDNISLRDVPELNIKLTHLLARRTTIDNSLRKLQQYIREYTALQSRLDKTRQQWIRALSANYLAESRLLSSIELFYLTDSLNLQASETLLERLRNLLRGGAENLVEQAEVQYLKALEAYQPRVSLKQ